MKKQFRQKTLKDIQSAAYGAGRLAARGHSSNDDGTRNLSEAVMQLSHAIVLLAKVLQTEDAEPATPQQ